MYVRQMQRAREVGSDYLEIFHIELNSEAPLAQTAHRHIFNARKLEYNRR